MLCRGARLQIEEANIDSGKRIVPIRRQQKGKVKLFPCQISVDALPAMLNAIIAVKLWLWVGCAPTRCRHWGAQEGRDIRDILPSSNYLLARNDFRNSCRGSYRKTRWKSHRIIQGKKKHTNINKFAGLSRDWVGAKILFRCFFGVIPYKGEKINKVTPQNPGTIP